MDKLREERKELVVKEKEERGRLEDKFINLIKERGKRIAFYFIEQFQNFKKKQKKKGNFHNLFSKNILNFRAALKFREDIDETVR